MGKLANLRGLKIIHKKPSYEIFSNIGTISYQYKVRKFSWGAYVSYSKEEGFKSAILRLSKIKSNNVDSPVPMV